MSNHQLQELIKSGEGYKLEFKERPGSSIDKEICALANASGGKVLLGVDDSGEVQGYELTNTNKSRIQDTARNLDPLLRIDLKQINNVAIIDVPEGSNKPYSTGGRFYLRMGANSQQLSRDEIKNFFKIQGAIRFDEISNNKFDYYEDFNEEAYNEFLKRAGISSDISRDQLLENLGFLQSGKLNNTGVLFFCDDISKFFLNVNITCVLFQGDSKSKVLDQKVFDKDLISNYENAMTYLMDKLNTEYVIKREREEYLELPEDALREAILNAIAHRDYFSNSHIQINIHRSWIKIQNPASYPRRITTESLIQGSHPNNLFLFSMMKRADLVEKIGTGIQRINDAMRDYKLELPEIKYKNIWFSIIFKRPDLDETSYQDRVLSVGDTLNGTVFDTLNDTQKQIIKQITKNPNVTYGDMAEIIGKSRRTIIRNMKKLKEMNLVKRVGSDKTGHWEIINAG